MSFSMNIKKLNEGLKKVLNEYREEELYDFISSLPKSLKRKSML